MNHAQDVRAANYPT